MEGKGAGAVGAGEGRRSRIPLTGRDVAAAGRVVASLGLGLLGVYLTMPASDYSFLKLPRSSSLEDLQILRDHLENYTSDYSLQVLVGYCTVYVLLQTFMILGTIFMSLLAGALFGVLKGVTLVVFAATAGASSFYFLSKLIGRPLVSSLWPDKMSFFQAQVSRRREKLLNYILFLRVTPTLPNTFINVASPTLPKKRKYSRLWPRGCCSYLHGQSDWLYYYSGDVIRGWFVFGWSLPISVWLSLVLSCACISFLIHVRQSNA